MVLNWPNFLEYHTKDDSQPARKFNGNTKVISVKSMLTAIENYKKHQFNSVPNYVKEYIKFGIENNWSLAHSIQNAFEVNEMTHGRDSATNWVLKNSENYSKAWLQSPYKRPNRLDSIITPDKPKLESKIELNTKQSIYIVTVDSAKRFFQLKQDALDYYSLMSSITHNVSVNMESYQLD